MNIENEIFIQRRPRFERFGSYGFVETAGRYVYECELLGGDFRTKIEIDKDGSIFGKVIDTMTDEEYLPLRVASRDGAFVNTVRHEYEKVLLDIANSCYTKVPFASHQANRITEQVYNKYNDRPDFPWDGNAYKAYGTFRHTENQKWYALIMHIKMSLLNKENTSSSMVDVINVKVKSRHIENALQENGVYPAYHMNHKHWISIVLNDTLKDNRIMELLDRSYFLTKIK